MQFRDIEEADIIGPFITRPKTRTQRNIDIYKALVMGCIKNGSYMLYIDDTLYKFDCVRAELASNKWLEWELTEMIPPRPSYKTMNFKQFKI